MPKKTELTTSLIKRIAGLVKKRATWEQIAIAIGVHRNTLRIWRNQGNIDRETYTKGNRSVFHRLVDAIDSAKTERFEKSAKTVFDAAWQGKTTVTIDEIEQPDGTTLKKTTTKIEPPSSTVALKLLALELPEQWAETQKLQVDWKDHLKAQGHDPEAMKAVAKEYLDKRGQDEAEDSDTEDTEDATDTDTES